MSVSLPLSRKAGKTLPSHSVCVVASANFEAVGIGSYPARAFKNTPHSFWGTNFGRTTEGVHCPVGRSLTATCSDVQCSLQRNHHTVLQSNIRSRAMSQDTNSSSATSFDSSQRVSRARTDYGAAVVADALLIFEADHYGSDSQRSVPEPASSLPPAAAAGVSAGAGA